MRRASLVCCLLAVMGLSCSGEYAFGPYTTSSLGSLAAGVATFVPGTVPGEGEFLLTVYNTDSKNAYRVVVTPFGETAETVSIPSCTAVSVICPCDAESIEINLMASSGTSILSTLTITPDASNCVTRLVYIGLESTTNTSTTDSTTTTTETAVLTETVPDSIIDCTVSSSN